MISKKINLSIIFYLLYIFCISLLMMFLCRIIFYTYNFSFFGKISINELSYIFYGGLIYDIAAITIASIIFNIMMSLPFRFTENIIYQKITKFFLILPICFCLLANIADTVYYEVTLSRTTASVFSQFKNENNLHKLIFLFLVDYWYMLFLLGLFIFFFIYSIKKMRLKPSPIKNPYAFFIFRFFISTSLIILSIVGIRGSWFTKSSRPIASNNAYKYVKKTQYSAIVLNTPFTLYRTINKKILQPVKYFSSVEEQKKHFTALHLGKGLKRDFKKKNIVLFIIESFGKENIGALNKNIKNYNGYTPHFDSLIAHSLAFSNGIANSRKSISGMPAVIASIPSLGTPFIISNYSENTINSLATELGKMGYYSAFFHGAPNGSMGFDAFSVQAGIKNYFGKKEFDYLPNNMSVWGIHDEEFLQFFAQKINKMPIPFFASIFTLSSHHPYKLPEKYKNTFPKGHLPLHPTIGYVDMAIHKFMQTASKMPWYKNTIFIFTADHAPTFSYRKEYKNIMGYFSVPLVFFNPSTEDSSFIGFDDSTFVQQCDIMPSVLSYLNYPYDYISFGKNIFNKTIDRDWAISYNSGIYHWFSKHYLIQFNGKKIIGLFNTQQDTFLKHNIKGQVPDSIIKPLELKMKAYIQEFNRRMINNQLTSVK